MPSYPAFFQQYFPEIPMNARRGKSRIAYVNVVAPLGWHRLLYKQCRGLAERGFDVELYSRADNEQTVYNVKIKPVGKSKNRICRSLWAFRHLPAFFHNRYDIITLVNPELLPMAIILKFLSGSRIVFDCQEAYAEFAKQRYLSRHKKYIFSTVVKFVLSLSSRLLDGFIFADENISKDFRRLPTNRQVCFHNFPWLGMFPSKPKPWFQRQYDIVYPGTLSRTGGLFVILEAISLLKEQIPNLKCLFVGELSCKMQEEVDAFVEKNGLDDNVVFNEALPYSEIPSLLKDSKIGLVGLLDLPKFYKNIAGKIFDYMACGIPIVSVDLPPERRYITSGAHGYLVPPEAPQAMADAAYKILSNPKLGQKMAENCREHLLKQGYYAEKEIDNLVEFYNYILAHPRRRPCGN